MSRINIFDGVPAQPIICVDGLSEHDDNVNSTDSKSSESSESSEHFESSEERDMPYINENYFWQVIKTLSWRNLSDAKMDPDAISRIMQNMSRLQKKTFYTCYRTLFRELLEIVTDVGLFERYGLVEPSDRAIIISHMIAMGKKHYRTVCGDVSFIEYFIEANECQSFDVFTIILF